ncbi:hypothetical protein RAT170B_0880 [Rickettsia argasii T170-B]|uniref:Uncharacterized protein n=1 Tax=Rickettsia argasii T170-B TaxID=1268837 RepID=A0A0F3REK8_9RICK|nr:hypothetical protein RAT170B_0880 [Rickettsia argasii T170-B]
MVLTSRGTTFEKLDLLKINSPFKAHFKSILGWTDSGTASGRI